MSSINKTNGTKLPIYTIAKKYNQVFRCEMELPPKTKTRDLYDNIYVDIFTTIDDLELAWTIRYVYKKSFSFNNSFHSPWGITITPPKELELLIDYDVHFKIISTKSEGERYILMNSEDYSKSFESISSFIKLQNVIVIELHFTEANESSGSIIEDYSNFFFQKNSCDVAFIFEGQELLAHRQILAARNAVFASMFESEMIEKTEGRVEIIDIEQVTFKHLLYFIYCGRVGCSGVEDLLKLMIAADKYGAIDLVKICTNQILFNKKLTVENVINAFVTADQLNLNNFKKMCMGFIINNKSNVTKTVSYQDLVKSRGDLISELFCAIELKDDKFKNLSS